MLAPRLASPVIAALIVTGLCACEADVPGPPPAAPSAASGAYAFGGTDRAWIEINIAMSDELVPLLDLAPAHSRDPSIRALAAQVKDLNTEERDTLRKLHDDAALPAENPHEGMPMPGMMTPELVAKAAATDGPAFDRFFQQRLREHFEQGAQLARSETKSGVEPRSKALATDMIARREAFLSKLGKAPN